MAPGRQGSESKALTMQSECIPWRPLALVQLSPSSGLIMTPWPMVPTRMVLFFAMVHPLGSCGGPRLLRWRLYARRRGAATRNRTRRPGQGCLQGPDTCWSVSFLSTLEAKRSEHWRMDQTEPASPAATLTRLTTGIKLAGKRSLSPDACHRQSDPGGGAGGQGATLSRQALRHLRRLHGRDHPMDVA